MAILVRVSAPDPSLPLPEVRSLAATSLVEFDGAYAEAFADYPVPMAFPRERLGRLLKRRGFDSRLSFGSFDPDGRLVGFLLNG